MGSRRLYYKGVRAKTSNGVNDTYSTMTFNPIVIPVCNLSSCLEMPRMVVTKATVHATVLKALMMMNTIGFSLFKASSTISKKVTKRQTEDIAIQTGTILE
jgi:hypothetical protein